MSRADMPAYPSHGSMGEVAHQGMTLREYFAVHADQPGCSEICAVAGVGWNDNRVYLQADSKTGLVWADWWQSMPLEMRLSLWARVRVVQADALLAALSKPASAPVTK